MFLISPSCPRSPNGIPTTPVGNWCPSERVTELFLEQTEDPTFSIFAVHSEMFLFCILYLHNDSNSIRLILRRGHLHATTEMTFHPNASTEVSIWLQFLQPFRVPHKSRSGTFWYSESLDGDLAKRKQFLGEALLDPI